MAVSATSLPFREQNEFFRRKLDLPTTAWTDIYSREHDYAFVVAGANRNDLVADFRQAVEKVVAEGGTLEQFRKDFDRIVTTHGWDYNGGRNWRSRVIYETNLRSSYMAGRYEQLLQLRDARPYWQYLHNDAVEHPRPLHESWDGLILRWDDEWWDTHFPINAWGCQCAVRGLSDDDLQRMGKAGPDTAPLIEWEDRIIGQRSPGGPREVRVPAGIDPGFEHIPGKSRLESRIPPERPDPPITGSTGGPGLPNLRPSDPLPDPRLAPAPLLPDNLPAREYADAFLHEFGATWEQPAIFRDVIGEPLVVGKDLFVKRDTDQLKSMKNERGPFMRLLAAALKSPDEIWTRLEWHIAQRKAIVRRRYITRYLVKGSDKPMLAVFEHGTDGWTALTDAPAKGDVDDMRIGVRLYRRKE